MLLVSEPILGDEEKAALIDVIDSNWITMGQRVAGFERAFAAKHSADAGVAVSSCSAALHLALMALGVGSGDEVLMPSLSFVATANAVIYTGANPVFVDIESPTVPLISPYDAAAKCTSRTRAVIVMHYGGHVVDPSIWRGFAKERGLHLLEDSAHAVGTDRTAIFGDLAAFSFFGNKNMTTGEGGMILGNNSELLHAVRLRRNHGITTSTVERLAGAPMYTVETLGYNYRMDEFRAAVGMVQLSKVDAWNDRRKQIVRLYRDVFEEIDVGVDLPLSDHPIKTHHIFPVLLPMVCDRADVIRRLRDQGIQTSWHYPPIHHLPWYRSRLQTINLPHTENFAARELTLPLHPRLDDDDVRYVVRSLRSALRR